MPLFGAHLSIAGGYHNALLEAHGLGCDTVQLFTKQPSHWAARPIDDEQARAFADALRQTGLRQVMGHDSYLVNLASPDEALRRRSLDAFVQEMNRAETLRLSYLVMHPGAHLESGEDAGLSRVVAALDEAHARCRGLRVRVLVETTAGQGSTLGHRFEHLARILDQVKDPDRLGVCFDTCHVFAAGYPLAPAEEYEATMREFDQVVGLGRIEAFHVNDSLKPLGSRLDRHAHIGKGEMGPEPFRLLVNDPRFRNHPMVLELPPEGAPADLKTLRAAERATVLTPSGPCHASAPPSPPPAGPAGRRAPPRRAGHPHHPAPQRRL
jgi:deoxyribonuclease-4